MNIYFRCAAALLGAVGCSAQQPPTSANAIILAGGGYQVPPAYLAVAPGQVIVLHVHGITTAMASRVTAVPGPSGLPNLLDGISVDLIQGQAGTVTGLGLSAVYQTNCISPCSPVTGITLLVPFTLAMNTASAGGPPPQLRISQNGNPVGAVALQPVSDSVHVIDTCDDTQTYISAAVSVPQTVCAPAVMAGGALNSLYNLAHAGDELAVWLYGMGAITAQGPGCCVSPAQLSQPVQSFQLNFDYRPNAPPSPVIPGFGR